MLRSPGVHSWRYDGPNKESLEKNFGVLTNLSIGPSPPRLNTHIRVAKEFEAWLSGGMSKAALEKRVFSAV